MKRIKKIQYSPLRRVVDQNVHRRIGIERSPRLVQEVDTDRQVWWVHDDR